MVTIVVSVTVSSPVPLHGALLLHPDDWILAVQRDGRLKRIDIARRLLEESDAPIKAIAYSAGFGSTTTLRRAFLRRIGVTPLQYRVRFQTTGSSDTSEDESAAILS